MAPNTPLPEHGRVRQALTVVCLFAVLGTAVVGSNAFSLRDRLLGSAAPAPALPARSRVAGALPAKGNPTALRSQPWWQAVTVLEGTGPTATESVTIAAEAIQWRVTPSCTSGHLRVKVAGTTKPLVDADCTTAAVGYVTHTGAVRLSVTADGPWRLEVAQQVDAPLVEPETPAMTTGATVIAAGDFYRIDKTGMGKVIVYRQADGRYALRLVDFFVTPTVDLEIRFSELVAPHSSDEFQAQPSQLVAKMDVTAGSLNYMVPQDIDPTRYRSVVMWCAPVDSAYAAATLTAPR